MCAALLQASAWNALCDAVGRGDAGLLQLAERVQRRLLQSLLLAAHGLPGDAGHWAGHLLESTAAQLRQVGTSEAAATSTLQRADGLHLVVSLLERLRGAMRGTTPPTQAAVFQQVGGSCFVCCFGCDFVVLGWLLRLLLLLLPRLPSLGAWLSAYSQQPAGNLMPPAATTATTTTFCPCSSHCPPLPTSPPSVQFTSVAPALATLFDACRTQPVAVTLVLKLAGDVVEQHAAYLAPPDANAMCSWALRLLQLYSAHNLVRFSAVRG